MWREVLDELYINLVGQKWPHKSITTRKWFPTNKSPTLPRGPSKHVGGHAYRLMFLLSKVSIFFFFFYSLYCKAIVYFKPSPTGL